MIATILPGSTNFHAVGYNDRKVAKGLASLIEILNFGPVGQFGVPTTEEKIAWLQTYTSQNERIQKAQFHVAISCKGHEMTEEQLLDFAHSYMKEMGYMEPGQPLLVYAHRDTANTHLHLVTSRIGPDGRKIEHDNERRRSQEIIDRLTKINRGEKIDSDIRTALSYSISSMAQFKAVMNSLGYEVYNEVYNKEEQVYVKFGGRIRKKIDEADVIQHFKQKKLSQERQKQLRSILRKYRDMSADNEELKKTLKEKFGIDLVFFGKKDKPFGYMLIDHSKKEVIHGNRILSMENLLNFATPEERMARIELFIYESLEANPMLTQHELHNLLSKKRAYIKKGVLHFNGQEKLLDEYVAERLKRNNKKEWVEQFNPVSEVERVILCGMAKMEESDITFVRLSYDERPVPEPILEMLKEIAADTGITNIRKALRDNGFAIRTMENETFIINIRSKTIVNLTELGFDIEAIRQLHRQQQLADIKKRQEEFQKGKSRGKSGKSIRKPHDIACGSHTDNREWEVGQNSDIDSVEESKRLKM